MCELGHRNDHDTVCGRSPRKSNFRLERSACILSDRKLFGRKSSWVVDTPVDIAKPKQ